MEPDLEHIWTAGKSLAIEPDWPQSATSEVVRLTAPLDINAVTVQGVRFTMSAYRFTPFRWVTFQIEVDSKAHPKGKPMVRFEWLPKSPHSNKGLGPPEFRHIVQRDTHLHCFDLNWDQSEANVRKGYLPIAVPIEESTSDYQAALDFVEKKFRIKGVGGIGLPPWTERKWL